MKDKAIKLSPDMQKSIFGPRTRRNFLNKTLKTSPAKQKKKKRKELVYLVASKSKTPETREQAADPVRDP